jgi:hypothetical protein
LVVDETLRNPLGLAQDGGWGGHLQNAISHIDQAMKELDAAEKYAKEHHIEK